MSVGLCKQAKTKLNLKASILRFEAILGCGLSEHFPSVLTKMCDAVKMCLADAGKEGGVLSLPDLGRFDHIRLSQLI